MTEKNGERRRPKWYSTYALLLIGLVSITNYYDRNLISILVEPVKHDLHLTDSQIGLLSGIGFAIMYSLLGVPVAQLSDRFGRARVLGVVVAIWSVMTALTGRTVDFVTMLLARAGVGVGEAGGLPASHALVADFFSVRLRGKALSFIGVTGALGLSLAFAAGGYISDRWGWRYAFYAGAAPGLVLSLLIFLTLREPQRRTDVTVQPESLGAALAALWRRKAYVLLCMGVGVAAIGVYAQLTWTPAFLMRTYHMSATKVGGYIGLIQGPGAMAAIFFGGVLNDWSARRDARWPFWIIALSIGIIVPASFVLFLVHDFQLALSMQVVFGVVGAVWTAPSYALVQALAGSRLRALAAAIFMMLVNIVGLGLGPWVAGALSDSLRPAYGDKALAYSLCITSLTCVVGFFCFLAATRTVRVDVAEAERA